MRTEHTWFHALLVAPSIGEDATARALAAARSRGALVLLALIIAGCHSGSNPPTVPVSAAAPPPPPAADTPPSPAAWHGYFYGTVAIGSERYGEALLTIDGAVRMHISNTWDDPLHPEGSAQFIGQFEVDGSQGLGTGIVIGQECATFSAGRFCAEPAFAQISIETATRSLLSGELLVTTSDGEETWPFEMAWAPVDTYLSAATLELAEGQYWEELAEFAHGGDVVMNVDGAGNLFFQSPTSGCVGNGTLAPHLNGEFNVYDATLVIENCDGTYARWNGGYQGLATLSIESSESYYYYGYWGDWLVLWLSTPEGAASQAAVTMWGRLQ